MIPQIFDLQKAITQKKRAIGYYQTDAFFHIYALKDMLDRLGYVLQEFENILLVNITPFMWKQSGGEDFVQKFKVKNTDYISYFGSDIFENLNHISINGEDLKISKKYDLILCPLTLHIFNDLPGILKQFYLSLSPDGIFLANLVGENFLTNMHKIIANSELKVTGGFSPRVHPPMDVRILGDLMQRIGYALPVVDMFDVSLSYKKMTRMIMDLKNMGEMSVLKEKKPFLSPATYRYILDQAKEFYKKDGQYPINIDIISMMGRFPSDKQQKPIKPGTAKVRLNDVF